MRRLSEPEGSAMKKLYVRIAELITTIENCRARGNKEWERKHTDTLHTLVREHMPFGGGFDAGTKLDMARSRDERLVFGTEFHHTDDSGFYDGWTGHDVFVKASLSRGFDLRVTGKDKNGIKEYIAEVFEYALNCEVE